MFINQDHIDEAEYAAYEAEQEFIRDHEYGVELAYSYPQDAKAKRAKEWLDRYETPGMGVGIFEATNAAAAMFAR